jgi:hypothetical protein
LSFQLPIAMSIKAIRNAPREAQRLNLDIILTSQEQPCFAHWIGRTACTLPANSCFPLSLVIASGPHHPAADPDFPHMPPGQLRRLYAPKPYSACNVVAPSREVVGGRFCLSDFLSRSSTLIIAVHAVVLRLAPLEDVAPRCADRDSASCSVSLSKWKNIVQHHFRS